MSNKDQNSKVQIVVAVLGLVGVLGAALISKWDNIFPTPTPTPTPTLVQPDPPSPPPIIENEISIMRLGCEKTSGFALEEVTKPVAITKSMVMPHFLVRTRDPLTYTCLIPQDVLSPYKYLSLEFGVSDKAESDTRFRVNAYANTALKGTEEIVKGQGLKTIEANIDNASSITLEVVCELGNCSPITESLYFTRASLRTAPDEEKIN